MGVFFRTARAVLLAAFFAAPAAAAGPAPAPSRSDLISGYFNRSQGDIAGLRGRGYGYGEIVKILVIAEMSRKEIPALLKENGKGYGWGTLCVRLGLKPTYVKARVDAARAFLKISVRPAAKAAPEKGAGGEKAGGNP